MLCQYDLIPCMRMREQELCDQGWCLYVCMYVCIYSYIQWSPDNRILNLPRKIIQLTRIFNYPVVLNSIMLSF